MTHLAPLRAKLTLLRRLRRAVCWIAGTASILASSLVTLWALFALDLYFFLSRPQRFVMIVLAVLLEFWVVVKWSRRWFVRSESHFQVALGVENTNELDNDLIAALQFESSTRPGPGSPQLRQLVIQNMVEQQDQIQWFKGNWDRTIWKQIGVLTFLVTLGFCIATGWPAHVRTFGQRLLLTEIRYPSATRIQQIRINATQVYSRETANGHTPSEASVASEAEVRFAVLGNGQLPQRGRVQIDHPNFPEQRITLSLVSLAARQRSLQEGLTLLKQAAGDQTILALNDRKEKLVSLLWLDAPHIAQRLQQHNAQLPLPASLTRSLEATLSTWSQNTNAAAYVGRVDRLMSGGSYAVHLGDDWTAPSVLKLLPLPSAELKIHVTPPVYARAETQTDTAANASDLAVLAGSRLHFEVTCSNQKTLTSAWLTLHQDATSQRIDLRPADAHKRRWELPATETPLHRFTSPCQYEIQVEDTDGLQMPTTLRGRIQLRKDRLPAGTAAVVHQTVLPNARPVVEYQATDDFGIHSIRLLVEIQRTTPVQLESSNASLSTSPVATTPTDRPRERHAFGLLPQTPALAAVLPLSDRWPLDLSTLDLTPGDLLKLTLEIVDFRGNQPGKQFLSESVILTISDERGVLEAITGADQEAQQELNEIIQRQLPRGACP
ncbi:MAG: hypothetical protein VX346_13550 [Planctomycetota bacterium]|nr:hypothetical protein [Planctomycetota bacterium]